MAPLILVWAKICHTETCVCFSIVVSSFISFSCCSSTVYTLRVCRSPMLPSFWSCCVDDLDFLHELVDFLRFSSFFPWEFLIDHVGLLFSTDTTLRVCRVPFPLWFFRVRISLWLCGFDVLVIHSWVCRVPFPFSLPPFVFILTLLLWCSRLSL